MILALTFLILAIGCYSISQLVNHGKLRWSKVNPEFWGTWSSIRKYKYIVGRVQPPLNNWYYRFFKIKYKEAFPLSATFLIAFTDGYHACQALMFLFLSLSVTFALDFNWWLLLGVWSLIHATHFILYKILSK